MDPKIEQSGTKVKFNNQPKMSGLEADKAFDERRERLVPLISDFITRHERFANQVVNVTFSHVGVSSIIAILETPVEKLVLKIPLSLSYSSGEGQFLQVWAKARIKTPQVLEEGKIGEHSYLLMEYIDAPILGDTKSGEDLIKEEVFVELGHTLGMMHGPEAQGYGKVIDGRAEFVKFRDWLESPDVQDKIKYVQEQELLSDEHGLISDVLTILSANLDKDGKSSYCHDDFGASNMFATKPLTVFDPNPRFNNGFLDLARSVLIHMSNANLAGADEQLIKGYSEIRPVDRKFLQAGIILNAYLKFPYWHKTGKTKRMDQVRKYLLETRHFLEE